jgi:L-2-hydroxyglutarate oxidase LhgO
MREGFDFLIIGGGIVGLSIGLEIIESRPNCSVLICEKETSGTFHASGRNSGVIHAGFYYSPESLKAKLCKDGNLLLKNFCKENHIPYNEIGKVVVAKNESESCRIEQLASRASANGVEVEVLDEHKLVSIEPEARTVKKFLWSPRTAVANPVEVYSCLLDKFLSRGGKFRKHTKIELNITNNEVYIENSNINAKFIINAAGASSVKIARKLGIAKNYRLIPFKGTYIGSMKMSRVLTRLVYPVPHPVNPFLGVHFTKTVNGQVKIGPTAIPVLGSEKYRFVDKFSPQEAAESILGISSLLNGNTHDIPEILKSEIPKLFRKSLISEASELVPKAKDFSDWRKLKSGIRSQLVNTLDGRLEQDFIVENFSNSVHVLNMVSPGWTSSLAFSKYVFEKFIHPRL